MSRNIDAGSGEPSVVNIPVARSSAGARGGYPSTVAPALHSSRMPSRKSLPPGAARIMPIGARIRLVEAAIDARNTHFSHMSCRTLSLAAPLAVATDGRRRVSLEAPYHGGGDAERTGV